ncbi:MAG: NAD(+)/NADH kinase, partial [bacterium]
DVRRIALLCNPNSGTGKERVFELTRQACLNLRPQVAQVLVGPGEMGAVVCQGSNITVLGQDQTRTRQDTIETTKQMVAAGAECFVVVSGDGTYNDVLEGMKALGVTLPIMGVAAGRFNTIFPNRKHDPFVSVRGNFPPVVLADLGVEDVMGLVSRVNGTIVSYGFFWAVVCNGLAYTDPGGAFLIIDASEFLRGRIVPLTAPRPIATAATRLTLISRKSGEIEVATGPNLAMPIVAHIVDEINQIGAGGFGAFANLMGYDGVAYVFTDPRITFMPSAEFFPVETRAVGFHEGDHVRCMGLHDGAVFQVDSTPIHRLTAEDVLTVEVVRKLGKKVVIDRR